MSETRLPAFAAVIGFVDAVNRGDVDRLGELMTDDHFLRVFDEPPLRGKAANIDAWRTYTSAYPRYSISPHRLAEQDGVVSMLGHTIRSHLDLADDEEAKLRVIWTARVEDGRLASWELTDDTPEHRRELGLDSPT